MLGIPVDTRRDLGGRWMIGSAGIADGEGSINQCDNWLKVRTTTGGVDVAFDDDGRWDRGFGMDGVLTSRMGPWACPWLLS